MGLGQDDQHGQRKKIKRNREKEQSRTRQHAIKHTGALIVMGKYTRLRNQREDETTGQIQLGQD